MKKLLALVLALVMAMSLVTISNADFKDADEIDYTEAVEVLNAVGVLVGSDGKFNPKAELNRAQACKIIAYLDLGETVAEALPAVQVYSDVPASHWAAKYIAYCADAGYVSGVGDNKFDPDAKVTGYQFAKMLLCALGYDASIEELTGANWSIKVAQLMSKNDLAKGVDKLGSAALTREEAAQYALNALKADTVEYTGGTNITIGDTTIKQGATRVPVINSSANTYLSAINSYTATVDGVTANKVQLAEKLYEGKLVYTETGKVDDFGRDVGEWYYNEKATKTSSLAATTGNSDLYVSNGSLADADYAATVTDKTDAAAANGTTFDANLNKVLGITAASSKVTINGAENNVYLNGKAYNDDATIALEAGDKVEVYLTDGSATVAAKVIILRQTYAEILDVKENTGKATTTIDGEKVVYSYKITLDDDMDGTAEYTTNDLDLAGYTDAYVKGAYLKMYVKAGSPNTIIDTEIAETVSGAVAAFTSGENATIGSTKYLFANATIPGYGTSVDFEDGKYTIVLNDAGYAIAVITDAGNASKVEDVYYALDTSWEDESNAYGSGKVTVYQQVVGLDGVVKDVVVGGYKKSSGSFVSDSEWGNVSSSGSYTAVNGLVVMTKTAATSTVDEYYTLTADADGLDVSGKDYTFAGVGSASGKDLKTSDTKFEGNYLTNDTIVVLVNKTDADSSIKTSVYTGALGYTPAASEKIDYLTVTTSKGAEVVAIVYAGSARTTSNSEVLFVKSATTTVNADGYAQTVYTMAGEKLPVTVDAASKDITGFVTYKVDSDGVYTLSDTTDSFIGSSVTWNEDTAAHKGEFEDLYFQKNYYGDGYLNLANAKVSASIILSDVVASDAVVVDLRSDSAKEDNYDATIESVADLINAVETYYVDTTDNNAAKISLKINEDGAVVIFLTAIERAA